MWTYNYSTSSDELYHFGVKGMKWHNHIYSLKNKLSDAKTRASNKLSDAKTRASNKLTDEKTRAINKKIYNKTEAYENKQSKGKNIVKKLLLGSGGSTTYNMARAHGESRAKAAVRSIFDINLSTLAGFGAGAATTYATNKVVRTKNGTAGAVTGYAAKVAADEAVNRKLRQNGYTSSLQQKAMRKKYGY